jgi:hypothetical protein
VLLAKIALCQQHMHAVGKEFSFFRILSSNFFLACYIVYKHMVKCGPFLQHLAIFR